jgi:hypothetical protein
MQQKTNGLLLPPQESKIKTLTDSQSAYLIEEAQTRINDNMKKISELAPTLKDYYEAYLTLKKDHDMLVDRVAADKLMLEVYSKVKHGIPMEKGMRILRAESHNDMKPREKKKLTHGGNPKAEGRVQWTEHAAEILDIEKKFIKPEDLFEKVLDTYDVEAKFKELGREWRPGYIRWGIINNCWASNCKSSEEGKKSGVLVKVDGRIGLRDWVTPDMRIRPEFKTQVHL